MYRINKRIISAFVFIVSFLTSYGGSLAEVLTIDIIEIKLESDTLIKDLKLKPKTVATYKNGSTEEVDSTYISDNKDIAYINKSGELVGNNPGTTTIT